MSTRQYIGARYVPKFYQNSVDGSTQWESNVVYEPLMYVTLTNGHMYISKKQVPATVGSPVNNIDYWLDIGSYNGFIEQLQNEIDDINDVTIPALQADIALKQAITDNNLTTTDKTIVGAINELVSGKQDKTDNTLTTTDKTVVGAINELVTDKQDKTDNTLTTTDKTVVGAINELDSDVQTLTGDVADIKADVKAIHNNEFVLFGDSWCDENSAHAWVSAFCTRNGLTIHNYAASGAAFTQTNSIDNQIDLAIADIAAETLDANKISKVIMFAGVNDALNTSNTITVVAQAIVNAKVKIEANFPNADVIFIFNSAMGGVVTGLNTRMRAYSKELCRILGTYMPTFSTISWFKPSDYDSTKFHITADNRTLERNFMNILKNEGCTHVVEEMVNLTAQSGISGTAKVQITDEGSMLKVRLTNINLAAGSYTITMPSNFVFDNYDAIWCKFTTSTNTVAFVAITADFANNALTFTTTENLIMRDFIEFMV